MYRSQGQIADGNFDLVEIEDGKKGK